MAGRQKVQEYQRRTADGRVIKVRSYERAGEETAAAALQMPGRPPIAARGGAFAGGRSLPGVFAAPVQPVIPHAAEALDSETYNAQLGDRIKGKTEHLDDQQFAEELRQRIVSPISDKTRETLAKMKPRAQTKPPVKPVKKA